MALRQLLTNLSDPSTPVDNSAYPNQSIHLEGITFNQRSFRFGEGTAFDRPGQEFSREPFIGNIRTILGSQNESIPGVEDSQNKLKGLGFIDGATDGLVRGGILTALQRSTTDFTRLTNFYLSNRGIGFLIKQTALQATNPAIEDGGESIFGLRRNRQFNPLGTNLLAQSLVNFSGVHFDRAGLLPIWPEDAKYETIVQNKSANSDLNNKKINFTGKTNKFEGNRLVTLFNSHIKDQYVSTKDKKVDRTGFAAGARDFLADTAENVTDFVQTITGKNTPMLYEYGGGPGSTYGIGRTSIRKFNHTNTIAGGPGTNFDLGVGTGFIHTRELADELPDIPSRAANVQNYLVSLGRPYIGTDYQGDINFNNRKYYKESRIGIGNPGVEYRKNGRNSYIFSNNGRYDTYLDSKVDKLNMLDIVKFNGRPIIPEARDLIKFRFEAVDNDNPNKSNVMVFRAFLDDLKDNYNASFNEFNYNGRGETFYTYNNFKRDISFNFKIAAQTRHEMMPLYRKLNYLVSQTAPEYKGGRMRAGFVRLTIGSWCDRIPGFIQNVSLSWQKDYPWEISIDSPEGGQDTDMLVLPHVLDVSVSFLPIHNFAPQRSVKESPFILKDRESILHNVQKWSELDAADTTAEALRRGKLKLQEKYNPTPPIDNTNQYGNSGPGNEEAYSNFTGEGYDPGYEGSFSDPLEITPTNPEINPNAGLPGAMGSEGFSY